MLRANREGEEGFDADLLRRVQRHGDRGSLGDEQAERQPDQAAWVGEAEKVIAGRIFLKNSVAFFRLRSLYYIVRGKGFPSETMWEGAE